MSTFEMGFPNDSDFKEPDVARKLRDAAALMLARHFNKKFAETTIRVNPDGTVREVPEFQAFLDAARTLLIQRERIFEDIPRLLVTIRNEGCYIPYLKWEGETEIIRMSFTV